jgi:predicted glycoside hydrolase/deacetylase ChbG (UPF0249 family)/glycosyltransferase involved in cell wall biosynthesis
MYAVVVNADDLGYSEWRDAGIFRAYKEGLVTSASLLVNGTSAKSAARRAIKEGLHIGLHLNLTEGTPLTELSQIPTLLTKDSKLMYKESFWNACLTANADFLNQVILETRAQLHKFKRLTGGISATHLDGHQHVHVAPGIAKVLAPLLSAEGIVSTRIPDENVAALTWVPKSVRVRWAARIESAKASRVIYEQYGIYAPNIFLGQGFSGSFMSVQRILVSVRRQLPLRGECQSSEHILNDVQTAEIMVHPGGDIQGDEEETYTMKHVGFQGGIADEFALSPDREHEVEVLCQPELISKLVGPEYNLLFCNWEKIHEYQQQQYNQQNEGGSSERISNTAKVSENKKKGEKGEKDEKDDTVDSLNTIGPIITNNSCNVVRVLLLAIGLNASGNHVTALRMRQNMAGICHFNVTLVDANDATPASVLDTVNRNNIQIVVGLHAYHSGKLLYNVDNTTEEALSEKMIVPVIIVAGGTDLNSIDLNSNESSSIPLKRKVVQQSILAADAVVVFNHALHDRCLSLMQEASEEKSESSSIFSKIHVVPQAVDVSYQSEPWLRNTLGLANTDPIILLPSGIRPVKDPLFIVPTFLAWVQKLQHARNSDQDRGTFKRIRLVVMGCVRDEKLMGDLKKMLTESVGGNKKILCDKTTLSVVYHPPVSHDKLLAAINESALLLNTSLSEGMANVLLEAMALGKPVLARRNEGNCALIGSNMERGGLFTTAEECIEAIDRHFVGGSDGYHTLVSARVHTALEYVRQTHSCKVEAQKMEGIVRGLLSTSTTTSTTTSITTSTTTST